MTLPTVGGTRVLSIYQEVKKNMAAYILTLAVYVDYQKAHDKAWHKGLVIKLMESVFRKDY